MTIKDVLQLFKTINIYFPNRIKGSDEEILEMANYWLDILEDYEASLVANNLKNHIRDKAFAPTIADLVKQPENKYSEVMNVEETRLYIEQREAELPDTNVDKEFIREQMKIAREKLREAQFDEFKRNIAKSD